MARLSFPSRVVLVLLLAVILAAPAAMGGQLPPRAEGRQDGFLASVLISDLRFQVWSLLGLFWEKEGCVIDPHGGCAKTIIDNVDEGCSLDPHGGCGH